MAGSVEPIANGGVRVGSDLLVRFSSIPLTGRIHSLTLDWQDGRWPGSVCLPGDRLTLAAAGPILELAGDGGPLAAVVQLVAPREERYLSATCSLTNRTAGPLCLVRMVVTVRLEPPVGGDLGPGGRWLRNGWQSWSFAGMVSAANPTCPLPGRDFVYRIKEDSAVARTEAPFVSEMVTALVTNHGSVVAGAGPQLFFQRIRVRPVSKAVELDLEIDLDRFLLAGGARLVVGEWQLDGESTATQMVRRWADRVGRRRQPAGRQLTGWCSWYDRFRRITPAYLQANCARLAALPGLGDQRACLVDDGYCARIGDWTTPASHFGLTPFELPAQIQKHGLAAGIWVAPFIAQGSAQLLRDHPDWVARQAGKPFRIGFNPHWKGFFYPLDLNHTGVLGYLHDLFGRLAKAGFALFKLDYLFAGALPVADSYGGPGRFRAYIRALEVIRDAVGPEALLLGCGAPLAPSNGQFDSMRVTTDVAHTWKTPWPISALAGDDEITGILPVARNLAARAAFSDRFWLTDPDCLLLRSRRGSPAAPGRRLLAAGMAALNGEVIWLGDDLQRWDRSEEEELARLLRRRGRQSVALDYCDRPDGASWMLVEGEEGPLVAACNLGDRPLDHLALPLPLLRGRVDPNCTVAVGENDPVLSPDNLSISALDAGHLAVVSLIPEQREAEVARTAR